MYASGRGVPQSDSEAVKWYRLSADQGNAMAQCSLGTMYAGGRGVPKSDAEAVKWYRKAATQGETDGQLRLGLMYANGRGVAQSDAEAVRWCREAADQGHAGAQYSLGIMYEQGRGVPESPSVALEWYAKATQSYLRDNDRGAAASVYDQMKSIDPEHRLTKAVHAKLWGLSATAPASQPPPSAGAPESKAATSTAPSVAEGD
jgi:hypothetical protein